MNLSDGRRSVSSCLPFSTHLPLQVPRANSDCVSTTALPSTSVGAPDIQDPLSDAASDGLPLSAFSDTYDSTAALSATEPVDEISVCAFSASATAVNIPEEGVGEDVHDEDPVDAAPIAVASPIAFAAPAAVPARTVAAPITVAAPRTAVVVHSAAVAHSTVVVHSAAVAHPTTVADSAVDGNQVDAALPVVDATHSGDVGIHIPAAHIPAALAAEFEGTTFSWEASSELYPWEDGYGADED